MILGTTFPLITRVVGRGYKILGHTHSTCCCPPLNEIIHLIPLSFRYFWLFPSCRRSESLLLFTYYSDLLFWIKLRNISNSSYCDLILLSNTQLCVYICRQYKQFLIQIKDRDRNSSSAALSSIQAVRHRLMAAVPNSV